MKDPQSINRLQNSFLSHLRSDSCIGHYVAHLIDGDLSMWTVILVVLNNSSEIARQRFEQIRDVQRIVDRILDWIAQSEMKFHFRSTSIRNDSF